MKSFYLILATCLAAPLVGCSHQSMQKIISANTHQTTMALVPAGPFVQGSDRQEREYAYRLDEARGSHAARQYQWFENESRQTVTLPAFLIDLLPVTQYNYLQFVQATGYPPPRVTEKVWKGFGLAHSYDEVRRFLWQKNKPPHQREQHPVVLVSHQDAEAYCLWLGKRLPTAAEWEKAARGTEGRYFPWGDQFDARYLNSQDKGPYDTEPVGQHPEGKSPYGVLDMAGQVFEWTATPCPDDRFVVKGGSWDDFPGVTRSAAWHCRPAALRHILIGFRCAKEAT
ncbi:MAG: hypothetical protein D6698_00010 [Gammaproteobacteria bacterium]|nr:MAG: hypothetical protein D6698_00010 [Gammaproteobacteria bacterium]